MFLNTTFVRSLMEPTTSPYLEVRKSPVHGTGIFAAKDIPAGTKIIRYVGRKISKEESDDVFDHQFEKYQENPDEEGGVYIFELNKKYDIDGNVSYNTARFINHSCDPNCESENTGNHIWIVALRDIKQGEELTYNYGYNVESYEDHPCRCGSENCVGYIVDQDDWPKLKELIKKSN